MLQELSYRNHFLSAIARSISGVHRHTESHALKTAVERLERQDEARSTRVTMMGCGPGKDLISVLKLRIWTMVQKSLFDPLASRKLKSFKSIESIASTSRPYLMENLLDDDILPSLVHDMGSSNPQDHEELFLDSESGGQDDSHNGGSLDDKFEDLIQVVESEIDLLPCHRDDEDTKDVLHPAFLRNHDLAGTEHS